MQWPCAAVDTAMHAFLSPVHLVVILLTSILLVLSLYHSTGCICSCEHKTGSLLDSLSSTLRLLHCQGQESVPKFEELTLRSLYSFGALQDSRCARAFAPGNTILHAAPTPGQLCI